MFELSVARISAKLQKWMEAAESCGQRTAPGVCDVAEPLVSSFLWRPKLCPSCSFSARVIWCAVSM